MKNKFRFLFPIFLLLLSFHNCFSQRILPENSYDIYRQIKQLNNLTHILYLAAHPDDENTRLLSYFVHEKNYKTYYLSLTRGEGGQNLIGLELGQGLGLIRNYELNAARDIDGAHQLFSSTIDFGYSKNPDETFSFWDKEKIIQETQDIIQLIKPDVIICRFPTTGEGGHGQHTASAIIALEAFNRTLNTPGIFHPERLLFNSFRFGDRNTIKEGQFSIRTQQYNPGLGISYGELAGTSRSIHRSQGAGTPQSIGMDNEYFELMAGVPIIEYITDRNISWERVNAPQITKDIDNIITSFSFIHPSHSVKALEELKTKIKKEVKDEYWKNTKIREIDNIIIACSGLTLEALSSIPESTYDNTITVKFNAVARMDNVKITEIKWDNQSVIRDINLENDVLSQNIFELYLDNNLPVTQPFWMEKKEDKWHYDYSRSHALDYEIKNYPYLDIKVTINNTAYDLRLPVAYKYLHPLRGDVTEYFRITPPLVINPEHDIIFLKNNEKNFIEFKLKTYKNFNQLKLQILNENNNLIQEETLNNLTPLKDSLFTIELKEIEKLSNNITLKIIADKSSASLSQHYIKYDHLPELVFYKEAKIRIVHPEWQIPQQKIAYIHGAGDQVAETLKNIGLNIEVLASSTLSQPAVLKNYNTIILGVRAYNTLSQMNSQMDILMKYVEDGGRLIVQYNTSNNLLTGKLGPYPFKIGRSRVTDELAAVTIINEKDPLMNYPHKIRKQDFDNWIQERGLYYPSDISPEYTSILEMNDPGESPLSTALIYTRYGKGVFIYTSLAFFRQIPAGNPGAVKLLINCIELK